MSNFVNNLFNAPDTSKQDAQIATAKEQQTIALTRQKQDEQNAAATQEAQLGLVTRQPRGRRLLMASTGESGVSSGSQTTLGTS